MNTQEVLQYADEAFAYAEGHKYEDELHILLTEQVLEMLVQARADETDPMANDTSDAL